MSQHQCRLIPVINHFKLKMVTGSIQIYHWTFKHPLARTLNRSKHLWRVEKYCTTSCAAIYQLTGFLPQTMLPPGECGRHQVVTRVFEAAMDLRKVKQFHPIFETFTLHGIHQVQRTHLCILCHIWKTHFELPAISWCPTGNQDALNVYDVIVQTLVLEPTLNLPAMNQPPMHYPAMSSISPL